MRSSNFFILFISFLCALIIGEIIVRQVGFYDIDNNFHIGTRILPPINIPLKQSIENYEKLKTDSNPFIVFDSICGWLPNNTFESKNGWYFHDSAGIRSDNKEYLKTKPDTVLRVLLFGDSHIYGSENPFHNTLGYYIEQLLFNKNITAEVINMGVGAFGMDQAFLRWKYYGKHYRPDIVVFGFQPENVMRNVNLLRALYIREGRAVMKPRYILDHDSLRIINFPVPTPEESLVQMKDFANWKFAEYETFYDANKQWWHNSKLLSLVIDIIRINRFDLRSYKQPFYELSKEPALITLKLMSAFRNDVVSNEAQFFIVHLPMKDDLIDLINGKKVVYETLLSEIGKQCEIIRPERNLINYCDTGNINNLFRPKLHYSGNAHKITASAIIDEIIKKQQGASKN